VVRLLTILVLFLAVNAFGQTSVNPEISAIGDFRLFTHDDQSRSEEAENFNLADPELELNIGGYLNPYARADAVLAWHGEHNAEIEELYATVERGLPLNSNLRVGKYMLEFGRLNPVHPHAYSFIQRPLPHETLFGEHGLSDMAVRAGFLIPTGEAYTEAMVGVLKGDVLAGHAHSHEHEEGEEEEDDEDIRRDPGFFGRLTTSLATGESSELALGASMLNAVHAAHAHEQGAGDEETEAEQFRAWLFGGDVKYKYSEGRNTALQIEAEVLTRIAQQEEGIDDLTSLGAYGYIDYRFMQQYNLGGIFEFVRTEELHEHEEEEEFEIHESDTWRVGLFAGWAPIEETSLLRLAGHWTEPDEADGFFEITLQFVISLGPHKPHNF